MNNTRTTAITGIIVLALGVGTDLTAQAQSRPRVDHFGTFRLLEPGASIGVSIRDLSASEQSSMKPPSGGAVVTSVVDRSPAATAGVRTGDIVIEFDGERVRSAGHLTRLVRETPAGRTVIVVVLRDGARRSLEVTPEESDNRAWLDTLPDPFRTFPFGAGPRRDGGDRTRRLGVALVPLGDQLAGYFGVTRGALVSAVDAGSPAAQAGVKAGDVITAVNGREVQSPSDVVAQVREARDGTAIDLRITRDRRELTLRVSLSNRTAGHNALPA
jgi:serine protease Do